MMRSWRGTRSVTISTRRTGTELPTSISTVRSSKYSETIEVQPAPVARPQLAHEHLQTRKVHAWHSHSLGLAQERTRIPRLVQRPSHRILPTNRAHKL